MKIHPYKLTIAAFGSVTWMKQDGNNGHKEQLTLNQKFNKNKYIIKLLDITRL